MRASSLHSEFQRKPQPQSQLQSPLQPSDVLQKLVETHLRDSLALRAIMRAEKSSLRQIMKALEAVPPELHAELVGTCMQHVARRFVDDS